MLTQIKSSTDTYLGDVGYDEFGARTSLVAGNGVTSTYAYEDGRRFLLHLSTTTTDPVVQFHNLTYQHDAVGNIKQVDNDIPLAMITPDGDGPVSVGPLRSLYAYDDLDRLTFGESVYRDHPSSGSHYDVYLYYDSIDNIVEKWSPGSASDTFDATDADVEHGIPDFTQPSPGYDLQVTYPTGRHQPSSFSETIFNGYVSFTRTPQFDANGNNKGDNGGGPETPRTLTWDEENRLKQVDMQFGPTPSTMGRYLYAPDGERTQKQDQGGGTTFYVNQYLVIDKAGNVTKHFYAGDTRVASKTESAQRSTVRNFYHPDHLGSTSYVTDAAQHLIQHDRYYPSGELWSEETATGLTPRDYLFTGKEYDRDTKLYYFGARYYDPRLSSWMSTDPILGSYMLGGPNGVVFQPRNLGTYTYAWNNPLGLLDPTGLGTQDGASGGDNEAWVERQVAEGTSGSRRLLAELDDFNHQRKLEQVAVQWWSMSAEERRLHLSQNRSVCQNDRKCSGTDADKTRDRLQERFTDSLGMIELEVAGADLAIAFGASAAAGEFLELGGGGGEADGEGFDLALGLSKHPDHQNVGLLGRFAEHVDGKTYWDFFEPTSDLNLLGRRTLHLMDKADHIHFNLDGMLGNGVTMKDIARWGSEGIGQGNVTNWEFFQVMQGFRAKTTFYP